MNKSQERIGNILLKFIYHALLLGAIGFAMYLYSDDYSIFPWATHDEALKFLHLIITVPIPLLVAFIVNLVIPRNYQGLLKLLISCYPLICFCLISCFIVFIHSLEPVRMKIGFGLTILLFLLELLLAAYDLIRNKLSDESFDGL